MRTRTIAALAAAFALIIAAPAAADSIAYVKDGNVWLSTLDGARQFQVTSSRGYSDVSQAEDGTMIGLHGVRLHRLDRTGRVLADFDTPVTDTRPAPSRVFYVATVPHARRRGLGDALTRIAARAGFEMSADAAWLGASVMGAGLYRRIGFEPLGSTLVELESPTFGSV